MPSPIEQIGEVLGNLDRGRANQHRLARLVALLDLRHDRVEFAFLRAVDKVGVVRRGRWACWSG